MTLTTMNGTIIPADRKNIPKFRIYKNTSCDGYALHWHTGVEIVMPLENSYNVIHGKETYTLKPDEICLINSNVMHRLSAPQTKGTRIFLQFDLTLLYNLSEFDTMFRLLPPILKMNEESHGDVYREVLYYVKEIIKEYNEKNVLCDATIYSYFIQVYITVFKNVIYKDNEKQLENTKNSKRNEHVQKLLNICRYVNDHFTEDLLLDEVAAKFNFSKYHFSRIFKEFAHSTFHHYLSNLRVNYSETLLADNDLSIMDVALMSGFNSISTFNRVFKEQKHMSPTSYRRQYAGKNPNSLDSFYSQL